MDKLKELKLHKVEGRWHVYIEGEKDEKDNPYYGCNIPLKDGDIEELLVQAGAVFKHLTSGDPFEAIGTLVSKQIRDEREEKDAGSN
jgi:hypothetical protein